MSGAERYLRTLITCCLEDEECIEQLDNPELALEMMPTIIGYLLRLMEDLGSILPEPMTTEQVWQQFLLMDEANS